jgi:hypothetical protein
MHLVAAGTSGVTAKAAGESLKRARQLALFHLLISSRLNQRPQNAGRAIVTSVRLLGLRASLNEGVALSGFVHRDELIELAAHVRIDLHARIVLGSALILLIGRDGDLPDSSGRCRNAFRDCGSRYRLSILIHLLQS